MAESPFKDDDDIRKFWAYVMSRDGVQLTPPRAENAVRVLNGFADEMQAVLEADASTWNPLKKKQCDAYNQEKDLILGSDKVSPEDPGLIPLRAIRQQIISGRYDRALLNLDFDVSQLRTRHEQVLGKLMTPKQTTLSALESLQRKLLRAEARYLQPFSFRFTGKDADIDIRRLEDVLNEEHCLGETAGQLRGEEPMADDITFALTPHAVGNIQKLIRQYPCSAEDRARYEQLSFILTQPHPDHVPVKSPAAALVDTIRQESVREQREKVERRQEEAIVRLFHHDCYQDGQTGKESRFSDEYQAALDAYVKAQDSGNAQKIRSAFFRIEDVFAGAVRRNARAIAGICQSPRR